MCGSFARYNPLTEWVSAAGHAFDPARLSAFAAEPPRYNIAPGTKSWLLGLDNDGEPALAERMWTFPTPRGNRINVRSETAHRVPEYREPFNRHRVLALANGFYEPKGPRGEGNRPWYYFREQGGAPLFLGAVTGSSGFSILTRPPNGAVARVHERTPVLAAPEHVVEFLDRDVDGNEALRRFAPPGLGERLEGWLVGHAAKRAGNEGRDLIDNAIGLLPKREYRKIAMYLS